MSDYRAEAAVGLAITLAQDFPLPDRGHWIEELNIGHLSSLEQNKIIEDLSDTLGKRAANAVARRLLESSLSAEAFRLAERLGDSGDFDSMYKILLPVFPDLLVMQKEAIQTGIEEYKQLVNEQVARRQSR